MSGSLSFLHSAFASSQQLTLGPKFVAAKASPSLVIEAKATAKAAVVGQGFVAINIKVRNTAGAIKHQAVAVRNGADMSTFYSCSFEGYQDTLYTHSLRQFYRECDIYGTVDFIFGNAAAVFQDCNIYARLPMQGQFNVLTAQGRTDPNLNTGIPIHNC
ncbi:PREDICTED: probable pectinesterase/pectinesterase inhibitor 41 [Nelumbo nucifera]|uniref:Pectinesterase n=2 Tax=Nelumbo nucifera TaxID=4432 RepID=A0A1U8Q6D3_NELNU|nr:PREDICTED: probable pectinesterase/pectinesterase inhibitor 41 [Nelumbo nucifera]DAD40969.1 TPA_asm: hypothetical protein HUJ06_015292 [Nelumbo nucifera]